MSKLSTLLAAAVRESTETGVTRFELVDARTMTDSPERTRLLHEYTAERIDLANAAAFVGSNYSSRPGYPTRERVARWNREWSAMVESERCPVCGLCGVYVRFGVMRCRVDGSYLVQLGEGVKRILEAAAREEG